MPCGSQLLLDESIRILVNIVKIPCNITAAAGITVTNIKYQNNDPWIVVDIRRMTEAGSVGLKNPYRCISGSCGIKSKPDSIDSLLCNTCRPIGIFYENITIRSDRTASCRYRIFRIENRIGCPKSPLVPNGKIPLSRFNRRFVRLQGVTKTQF